jgi:hypothetical protein
VHVKHMLKLGPSVTIRVKDSQAEVLAAVAGQGGSTGWLAAQGAHCTPIQCFSGATGRLRQHVLLIGHQAIANRLGHGIYGTRVADSMQRP